MTRGKSNANVRCELINPNDEDAGDKDTEDVEDEDTESDKGPVVQKVSISKPHRKPSVDTNLDELRTSAPKASKDRQH